MTDDVEKPVDNGQGKGRGGKRKVSPTIEAVRDLTKAQRAFTKATAKRDRAEEKLREADKEWQEARRELAEVRDYLATVLGTVGLGTVEEPAE